ncbi:serine hydrolase domain-containing protein [Chroococcidiopsis thermalis]|uniref:Beta-lactamase n=1 Tax=Chroococcidiopsis thermalis (strain PCC 7203) TaxID=251229 RepID=K9U0E1_CHRTP|nr:serine hydrolase [Chroococcidiopsis thermalis]AFY88108.1 beta-lactamase [Chroococcidiopsis thermalis PCC 7203]
MKPAFKYILWSFGLISVSIIGYISFTLWRVLSIGTAYQAKQFCSGVFVSQRTPESIFNRDVLAEIADLPTLEQSIVKSIKVNIDRPQQSVTASIFGLAKHQAIFRPGLGCTLVIDRSVQELRSQTQQLNLTPRQDRRWLQGKTNQIPAEINQKQLAAAMDWIFNPQHDSRAVVIVYKGEIVAERYAPGFSAQMPLLGWSMTKSVMNALVGILVKQGKLSLTDENLMPEWNHPGDRRSQIALDRMLRMSSGLKFDENEGNPLGNLIQMLFGQSNVAAYAASQPLEADPGSKWQYASGTSNILSRIVRRAVGDRDADYLTFPRRALFNPLGMSSAVIEPDASGTFIGSAFMYATARDWARFGLLYLQDGVWEGQRILPEGWVKYSRTPAPAAPKKNYGAHFWLMNVSTPSGHSKIMTAQGFQDQYTAIIPSHQLVIVHLGRNKNRTRQQFIPRVLAAFAN